MEHFITGPSCADLWSRCGAYLQMRKNAPEKETSYSAEEGTTAHHFSEEAIQCGTFDVRQFIGMKFDRTGIECTAEMADDCNVYTERVKQLIDMCRHLGVEVHYRSEYRVNLTFVYHGFFGTRDFHVIAIYGNWAIVIDLKFGRVLVDAEDNRQLMCYALDIIHNHPNVEYVRFEIVQPRGNRATGPIDVAEYTRAELEAFIPVAAEMQARNHSNEPQEATAGPHCTYCEGAGICRANAQRIISMVEPVKFHPNIMTAEEAERLVMEKKLIQNFLDKAYAWSLNLAQKGAPLHDLKMVSVPSREKFRDGLTPEEAAKAIKLVTGQTPDMDEIAPRRMGAVSTIRNKYGDAVAKMLTAPKTTSLELRKLNESGTPVQSAMMLAVQQPIIPLEKK